MTVKQLTDLGQRIFMSRYAYPGETNYSQRARAMAKHVAAAEDDDQKEYFERKFHEFLSSGEFVPGGRIIFGSGRQKQNMFSKVF